VEEEELFGQDGDNEPNVQSSFNDEEEFRKNGSKRRPGAPYAFNTRSKRFTSDVIHAHNQLKSRVG
jgi:hypothetical protein